MTATIIGDHNVMSKTVVIIPTYQSGDAIASVTADLLMHGFEHIIVVDDCCPDDSTKFLKNINVLVCTVPYTPKTHGLLSRKLFDQLSNPTYLINVARGKVQNEEEVISAINEGILTGAFLDVFEKEPLPVSSPLWNNKKIKITPHIASITNSEAGANQIIENYNRNKKGESLLNQVDLEKGY